MIEVFTVGTCRTKLLHSCLDERIADVLGQVILLGELRDFLAGFSIRFFNELLRPLITDKPNGEEGKFGCCTNKPIDCFLAVLGERRLQNRLVDVGLGPYDALIERGIVEGNDLPQYKQVRLSWLPFWQHGDEARHALLRELTDKIEGNLGTPSFRV